MYDLAPVDGCVPYQTAIHSRITLAAAALPANIQFFAGLPGDDPTIGSYKQPFVLSDWPFDIAAISLHAIQNAIVDNAVDMLALYTGSNGDGAIVNTLRIGTRSFGDFWFEDTPCGGAHAATLTQAVLGTARSYLTNGYPSVLSKWSLRKPERIMPQGQPDAALVHFDGQCDPAVVLTSPMILEAALHGILWVPQN